MLLYGQNLVINGDLEQIKVHDYNEQININSQSFDVTNTRDTSLLWGLMDKRLANLTCIGWNYYKGELRNSSGYYSNIGLARSGNNLNVIEVYKTWTDRSASVKNVAVEFCRSLEPGKQYDITFYIKPLYGDHFTNNIGVWLIERPEQLEYSLQPDELFQMVKKGSPNTIEKEAYRLPLITDTTHYTKVSFTYTANGSELYLYVGNRFFYQKEFWKKKNWKKTEPFGIHANNGKNIWCYYAIDDVSVVPVEEEPSCPSEHDLPTKLISSTLKKDTIAIAEILFDLDKDSTNMQIKQLVSKLSSQYSNSEVLLIGHADDQGTEQYNYLLAEERVYFVYQQLRPYIAQPMKLISEGELKPKYSDKALNRRVEVYLLTDPSVE